MTSYIIRIVAVGLQLFVLGLYLATAQSYSLFVKGKITDAYGNPMKGVLIQSEHGKNGTSTDINGQYTVAVDDGSLALIFSMSSFTTQILKIENGATLDVRMEQDIHGLDEIVPLGWNQQKRRLLTGAVSTVKGTELERAPVANLTLGFAGRFSGLTTQETSSELSRANTNLYVRGFSTSRSGGPLVMVDGIMIPYNANQTLDYISPSEIESVVLLKDGIYQSMYGILGGNGVLLVETKRGRKGDIEINTRLDHSVQQVTTRPNMMPSGEYAALRQEAWHNDYNSQANYKPLYTEEQIQKFLSGSDPLYPNNNWYDYYFRELSNMQRIGLNVTGGNDRVKYYSNVNFMHQSGYFNTEQEDYKPNPYNVWANYRSNIDMKINKYLTAFVRLAGNVKREHTPGEGNATIYSSIFHLPPTMYGPLTPEAFDPETGEELPDSKQVITSGDVTSPTYGMLNRRGYRNHTVTNIFSQFGAELDLGFLTTGLSANGLFTYQTNTVGSMNTLQDYRRMRRNTLNLDELNFSPIYTNVNDPLGYTKSSSHYYHLSYQGQINYGRTFGRHHIGGVGYMFYQNLTKADTGSPGLFPYNRMSSGAKASYAYDERYIVDLIGGYSGSEQFARDRRYTFTPGIGLAWALTNEAFMKDVSWLSLAKFRGTWSKTATDQNGQGRFSYVNDVTVGRGGPIAYLQYLVSENRFGNPMYAAEQIEKRNIGVDIGLFNVITITADLFDERTDNMMVGATSAIPTFQGIPLGNYPNLNVGVFENKGYELSLDVKKSLNQDWFIGFGGHLSKTKNNIISNNEAERAEDYIYPFRSQGFSVGQAFGYVIDHSKGNGYINTAEELSNSPKYERSKRLGDFLYQDLNADGVIDDRDRVPLGTGAIPTYSYGIYGKVNYKNVDLNVLFQGVGGYSRIVTGWGVQEHHYEGIYANIHKQAWTEERYQSGAPILYPALSTNATASHEGSDFYVNNMSYLRLKNLEIGYTVPLKVAQKIGADKIRFLLSGQNLLTWSHMKTEDFGPEGGGFGAIPVYRVFNLGVNLMF